MPKQSKSTRKFEKNHLKSTIDRRKEFAKVKQRHQVKDKKRQRAAQKAGNQNGKQDLASSPEPVEPTKDMNDDAFFQDSLSIPSDDTVKALKGQNGKRRRDQDTADEEEAVTLPDSNGDDSASSAEDPDNHRGQLESLAKKDPEFYKYLQENDAELLDFNADDDLADLDDLGEDDDERPKKKQKKGEQVGQDVFSSDVTPAMLEKWTESMRSQHSIKALREVVLAFRAAAHTNDGEDREYKYTIPNSNIYHGVMATALREAPSVLNHHLPIKESASGKVRVDTDSAKFKTLSPLIKSHASSLQHMLAHLTDASTLRMTIQTFEPLLAYLLQFRKFLKLIIKSISSIWSDNSSDEATRITAFLIIRKLMVIGDAGIRETVLKSTYEGIVKGSRNTTIYTLAGINLMKNSAAEIWGIDQKVSYTTGFTFIRQLAIHLRGNITKPTKDSYKTIYNWQFVHSLDFWSRVLSMHCDSLLEAQNGKESEVRPLIYPVVQITLGVMRLIPTSTYFPLRFQLMRALLRISRSTGTYIPLSSALLEVLNSAEMRKPAKASTQKPLDFASSIRAPVAYLKTRVYQDGVGEQVAELFSEFFVLWAKSIAYPELQLPVIVMLKRWLKAASKATGNKNGKLNQSLILLVQKSEANSKWIESKRNGVTFTPKDRAEVEAFLKDISWEDSPLGAFVVGQRNLREERLRVLEAGRREEERRRRNKNDEDADTSMV